MEEKKFKYKFTLFTPCYNSAPFIDRIKASVEKQTFRDFEWIVVNDNSSDNTLELLDEYIKTVDFPVKLINNKTNMMLAVNYNLAVEQTEGEYFVTLDHDDEYSPKYLEIMDELIKKYDNPLVAGIVARCQTQYGKITPTPAYTQPLMNWFEYGKDKNGNYTGEVPRAFKTDILRQYVPFESKLIHNPLIEAMMSDDGYTFITTNEIIRKYYVYETAQRSITNNRTDRLAYYKYSELQKEINRYTLKYHTSFLVKLQLCMAYNRAAIHCGLQFADSIKNVSRWRLPVLLLYPVSSIQVFLSRFGFIFNLWKRTRVFFDKREK